MCTFTIPLQKFGAKGEKTGWTYIAISPDVADALRPGQKTSFRVRGTLDACTIEQVALLPMGDGSFIIPVNADMRRALRKTVGASVRVTIEVDESPMTQSADLLACLADEPQALAFFQTLSLGHQTYFSQWIEQAKTTATKTDRLSKAVNGLAMGWGYSEIIRYYKNNPR